MAAQYDYELEFTVRDYECDLQGHVNNSVYQNYLEHTRHEFIKTIGLDFKEMFDRGMINVVARVELAYKTPLASGDRFVVKLHLEQEGVKFLFYQDIFRLPDNKLCLKGKVTSTSIVNGRLTVSDEIAKAVERLKAAREKQ
ncbi:MAG: acyl-CoA thioesterase [Prolixibacteraceae bacterium]|nr:acyl-CoA thioesterase [Prolixibacteraceae bacterium]